MTITCICDPTHGQSCTTCDGTEAELYEAEQEWADDDLGYEDGAA